MKPSLNIPMRKTLGCLLASCIAPMAAAEHPIAVPKIYQHKVEAAIVWLEPVAMSPSPTMGKMQAHIHNEVDMHEIKGSDMGFGAGGWISHANVSCTVSKRKSDWRIVFTMMPMVANDGPHYGRNIQLNGPGTYDEMCQIDPPDWNGFFRHVDKETGSGAFFYPFSIKGHFTWMGSGKAGGY